jgi:aldehyde:ferredoxin oxidoreductase
MVGGYWGKILDIDLTKRTVKVRELPDDVYKKFIGGSGLATYLIYNEIPAGADSLGPENIFVFSVGPWQGGSNILGSGRFSVNAKSPLTGIIGESLGGGYNAEEFKKTGFDAVMVRGKASSPVYVMITDDKAEIKDASDMWGKMDAFETEDAIKQKEGDKKIQVAPIGPAAENLVRYAGLICNYGHGCAGRTGMGAVMGSKKLKALAFRGTKKVPIGKPDELMKLRKEATEDAKKADFTKANREEAQAMAVIPREENGLLPVKNFLESRWIEGAKKIGSSGGKFNEVLKPKPDGCSNCIMGCHRRVTVNTGSKKYHMDSYGPEYETLAMIGADCLIDNLLAINKANELCNRYSLDTIEFGGVVAFAMEAYEKGFIKKEDLGYELKWGDADAMLKLLEDITHRKGKIPKLLGEGVRPAGKQLGCPDLALHVNGAVVPAHDPRAFMSMAVETATSMKGASHLHGFPEAIELGVTFPEAGPDLSKAMEPHATEKKGLAAAKFQDRMAIANSLVFCFFYEFSGYDFTRLTNLTNAITGWNWTPQDYIKAGERIVNLMNMFNIKHGMVPERDYWLPKRFFEPRKAGGAKGVVPPLKEMREEYFKVKDWPKGIPSEKKLKELGLDFAIKDLPK